MSIYLSICNYIYLRQDAVVQFLESSGRSFPGSKDRSIYLHISICPSITIGVVYIYTYMLIYVYLRQDTVMKFLESLQRKILAWQRGRARHEVAREEGADPDGAAALLAEGTGKEDHWHLDRTHHVWCCMR